MRRRLTWAFLGLVGLVVLVYTLPLARYLVDVERDRLATSLERDAFILAGRAKDLLDQTPTGAIPELQPYVDDYSLGHRTATVVITDWRGLLVASNDAGATAGEDYRNRPEIASALAGTPERGERQSRTLGETLVYVAVPVLLGDDVIGTVRISQAKSVTNAAVRDQLTGILVVGGISLMLAVIVAWLLATAMARPIAGLRRVSDRLADGDLDARAEVTGPSEVRELARAFNAMATRLGTTLEHQRAFAGEVSHQLRTPLTALRLRLEQVDRHVAAGESPDEALAASRTETERLQALIEQLLALARLEGGEAPTVTVDAASVASERVEAWVPLAEEGGVRLVVESPPNGRDPRETRCRAVDGALEQIIDNYVDNALSAAPSGSTVVVRVGRVSDRSNDDVVIDVVDQGPGLTEQQRREAFQRFWRGPGSSTSDGGSGLGLAVVRQLAMASGGTAELLAGDDGVGVCARIRLRGARVGTSG